MMVRLLAAVCAAACIFGGIARADIDATYTGPMSAGETTFVQAMQKDLMARFPHASDAIAAGYVRYTSEDPTGAISYANRQWVSDPTHPSQLWYDKDGNLLGADFSVPRPNGEPRPTLWGINPGRWVEFDGHVHWVVKDPDSGAMLYDQWAWNADFTAAGGSLQNPTADIVVKLGRIPDVSDVTTIFEFPTIWDLIVWVKPNPDGAFSNVNPDVTP